MAVTMRNGAISRRRVLASLTAAGATTFAGGIAKPYLSRAADRPIVTHGVQSGDVSIDSGGRLGARRSARSHGRRGFDD